jgi:8-oxo-dGTP diphosphatase
MIDDDNYDEKEIWTMIHTISVEGGFLVFHSKEGRFYITNDGLKTKIRNGLDGPTIGKPWGKFLKYCHIGMKNIVTHVENRTVDIIPVSHDGSKIYLIKRKNKGGIEGGLALPGGHIDPPETPEQAALRELSEEILENKTDCVELITELGDWVPEVVAPGKVPAEHRSITKPFVAILKEGIEPIAGDDAADGAWYPIDKLPFEKFHFLHHIDIINNWLKPKQTQVIPFPLERSLSQIEDY